MMTDRRMTDISHKISKKGATNTMFCCAKQCMMLCDKVAVYNPAYAVKLLLIAVMLVMSASVNALPSDANESIRLLADKVTFSERTGVTRYSGNVTITQGSLKLTADDLTVNLSANRSINSAIATGRPATMQQIVTKQKGLAKGQANKIDYNAVTGIVTLTGNAKLTQNGADFSGNVIRYSLKSGDVEASAGGSQRVELILPPNNNVNQQSLR